MATMPEIKLNKETVGFASMVIALVVTGITGYNWLLSGRAENSPILRDLLTAIQQTTSEQKLKDQEQDKRLDRTDRDRDRNTQALKEQTTETQKLKEAVVKLTTVIEQSSITKKAENDYAPVYPQNLRSQ